MIEFDIGCRTIIEFDMGCGTRSEIDNGFRTLKSISTCMIPTSKRNKIDAWYHIPRENEVVEMIINGLLLGTIPVS